MTFREFWPLYLRAHRLPGTRAMHYFATAIGVLAAIEAIASGQVLILAVGLAICYAMAIGAHWYIEHNQPLIRVNAFLGAVADLRMCYLAATGRMAREMARYGIDQPSVTGSSGIARAEDLGVPSNPGRLRRFDGPRCARYALAMASAAGLAAGFADLHDLVDPADRVILPVIQLGGPILAFSGALLAVLAALSVARQCSPNLAVAGGLPPDLMPARERSLRRACLVLLTSGTLIYGAAELSEHGVQYDVDSIGALTAVLLGLYAATQYVRHRIGAKAARQTVQAAGPRTRGVRVDGRANLVDLLENMLSFGKRRAILAATLDAADLQPGDRLVDVGCGTGELVLTASLTTGGPVAGEVIGIDATPGMIRIARNRAREARSAARFELAVAEALPLQSESAQAVTSSFFFHHLPTDVKREALREMWRILAPGGRLIITDYGWAKGAVGLIASFPMRFNFHEHVRGQLTGELERIIALEGLGVPRVARVFLGYVRVLKIEKPVSFGAGSPAA